MKIVTSKSLPVNLDDETIKCLVLMLENFKNVYSDDWVEIVKILRERNQLETVLSAYEKKMLDDLEEENKKKSFEEIEKEKRELEEFNLLKRRFQGNMGEPTTPEEFKNKYGSYPPGYDENGNRISKKK